MNHQVHPAIATPSWYQGLRQWALRVCVLILVCLCAPQGLVQAQTVYFHNDVAGSPIAATDEAGNLLWRESYRPYGEQMLKPTAANSQWFHGKPTDPSTGVSDFGARNYDPVLGRFLSIDPVDFTEKNIHSFNRYNYGNNNPLKFKDPDGRESTGQWIDNNAMQAAAAGKDFSTYGWAFAGTAWTYLGAEGISQLWDKGFSAGGFATMSAGIELAAVLPFGKLAGVTAKSVATIDTSLVRFTQSSVKRIFQDGVTTIDSLISALKGPGGDALARSIPPIRIFEQGGLLRTLDNRRLLAFSEAGREVPYVWATPAEVAAESWKLSATPHQLDGWFIRVKP